MRRTLLIMTEDEAPVKNEAPWSHPDLLGQMAVVLWDGHNKQWDARARNCDRYAHATSVGEAMQQAIALRDAPKRRRLEE